MVGRFSKPTHAPSGGKPPKSTPFRVYFLNSIFLASLSWIPRSPSCSRQAQMPRSQTNKGPIPDPAKFGRFRAKQPSTESFTRPEPRFSQKVIFALSGPLQRASKGPGPDLANLAISARSGPLQSASKGPGLDLTKYVYFCIKRLFTKSVKGPGELRRAWLQIWPILAISVLSGPLQRASKGPGPDLADLGFFCIKRSFTKSLEGPGPK